MEGEGGGEVSYGCSLLTPRPLGDQRRDPNNLAVNPTQASRDEKAAWESFRDTGSRKNQFGSGFLLRLTSCPNSLS